MRKRTKITMDPKYILMTIAIVSVALIIVSFRFQDKMTPIRTAVGSVVTPMQRGINCQEAGQKEQCTAEAAG